MKGEYFLEQLSDY